jgi:hypothetical protein
MMLIGFAGFACSFGKPPLIFVHASSHHNPCLIPLPLNSSGGFPFREKWGSLRTLRVTVKVVERKQIIRIAASLYGEAFPGDDLDFSPP